MCDHSAKTSHLIQTKTIKKIVHKLTFSAKAFILPSGSQKSVVDPLKQNPTTMILLLSSVSAKTIHYSQLKAPHKLFEGF